MQSVWNLFDACNVIVILCFKNRLSATTVLCKFESMLCIIIKYQIYSNQQRNICYEWFSLEQEWECLSYAVGPVGSGDWDRWFYAQINKHILTPWVIYHEYLLVIIEIIFIAFMLFDNIQILPFGSVILFFHIKTEFFFIQIDNIHSCFSLALFYF